MGAQSAPPHWIYDFPEGFWAPTGAELHMDRKENNNRFSPPPLHKFLNTLLVVQTKKGEAHMFSVIRKIGLKYRFIFQTKCILNKINTY